MEQSRPSFQPVALALTVVAALARLAPHPPNFTPVGAVALFGGAKLRGWQAYLVPLLAMAVTDPLLSWMAGAHPYSALTPIIYACFILNVILGRTFLRFHASPQRIVTVALAGSIQFFVITNFFVWLGARAFYPATLGGLATCYIAALPFFARTVLSDLFYSGLLFSVYVLLERRTAAFQRPVSPTT